MKINGREGNSELNKALGKSNSVLGCTGVADYAIKIANMDTDSLYRHGKNDLGLRPSNRKNARQTFEKRCIATFKEKMGLETKNVARKKLTKAKQKQLDEILGKIK